ncbi:MAG: HAD-IB family phosphatase [Candidatus Sericytochromatia bacterium]|nr:HAD-IB family phosphatase [Candidatus Sericytochromatia bacterium]
MTTPQPLAWPAEAEAALAAFFAQDHAGAVAVFDADETLWRGDVGEGLLQYLQAEGLLHTAEDAFARYEALCAEDKRIGYPYATTVMAGLSDAHLRQICAGYFATHFAQRVYAPQQQLMQRLRAAGMTPWIVSASNQWIVEAGAPYLGIDPCHVVGVRLALSGDRLSDRLIEPMTYREGKVAAIDQYIGQRPVLVAGDSLGDFEMLSVSTALQLLINPKDSGPPAENIVSLARERGWVQVHW